MAVTLKVQMIGVANPPLWRRIVMGNTATFGRLHRAIRKAFGFEERHLFCFHENRIPGTAAISPECTDIPDPKADSVFKVPAFNRQEFVYTYNDVDEWRFTVIIESVTPEAPTKMGVIA